MANLKDLKFVDAFHFKDWLEEKVLKLKYHQLLSKKQILSNERTEEALLSDANGRYDAVLEVWCQFTRSQSDTETMYQVDQEIEAEVRKRWRDFPMSSYVDSQQS